VFRENETSIVLSEIKERLPEFFLHTFLVAAGVIHWQRQ
jgi:hypothetical protein